MMKCTKTNDRGERPQILVLSVLLLLLFVVVLAVTHKSERLPDIDLENTACQQPLLFSKHMSIYIFFVFLFVNNDFFVIFPKFFYLGFFFYKTEETFWAIFVLLFIIVKNQESITSKPRAVQRDESCRY